MITTQPKIDEGHKYSKLFADAKAELNLSSDITSLEEYFTHIGTLAGLHSLTAASAVEAAARDSWNIIFAKYAKYLMVPLDEDYFTINLNTRSISVPSVFNSAVGLDGDYHAETLMFEVDRYFDTEDLIRTNIFVQWQSPKEENGSTLVSLIDYDSAKIRFGWTLSDKVIDGDGVLKFSIRFVRFNDENKCIYSLNTTPVTVRIKPALDKSIDTDDTDEDSWLFATTVVNGANSHTSTFPAVAYIFKNLDEVIALEEDTCTLEFGACARDTGALHYTWTFIPSDGSATINFAGNETNYIKSSAITAGTYYTKTTTYKYVALPEGTTLDPEKHYEYDTQTSTYQKTSDTTAVTGKTYFEQVFDYDTYTVIKGFPKDTEIYEQDKDGQYTKTADTTPVSSKTYYVKNGESYEECELVDETTPTGGEYYEKNITTSVGFSTITETTPDPDKKYYTHAGEGKYVLANVEEGFASGTTYYEPYASLTIHSSSNTNIAGIYQVDALNVLNGAFENGLHNRSKQAVLAPVTKITFTTDLVDKVLEDGKCALSPEADADNASASMSYQWKKATDKVNGTYSDISNATEASYEADAAGWYKVVATGAINRTTASQESSPARVTAPAAAPTISSNTGKDVVVQVADDAQHTITIEASASKSGVADKLLSDELTYKWEYSLPDKNPAQFADVVVGENGVLGIYGEYGEQLVVKYDKNAETFRCVVTNNLNGTKASTNSDNYIIAAKSS